MTDFPWECQSINQNVRSSNKPLMACFFFIDEADEWFFKGYDLTVDYDETLDEPKYDFSEDKK